MFLYMTVEGSFPPAHQRTNFPARGRSSLPRSFVKPGTFGLRMRDINQNRLRWAGTFNFPSQRPSLAILPAELARRLGKLVCFPDRMRQRFFAIDVLAHLMAAMEAK